MTRRFRIELTEHELCCLFIVVDEACENGDAAELVGPMRGVPAVRRARDKLSDVIGRRDAEDREREAREAPWIHPALLDGSHDPERADCACDWCEEGRAPAPCDHSSTAGAPDGAAWIVTCTRCGLELRRDPMRQPPGVPMRQPPGVPMPERGK